MLVNKRKRRKEKGRKGSEERLKKRRNRRGTKEGGSCRRVKRKVERREGGQFCHFISDLFYQELNPLSRCQNSL